MYMKNLYLVTIWTCSLYCYSVHADLKNTSTKPKETLDIKNFSVCFNPQSGELVPIQTIYDIALDFINTKKIIFPSTQVDSYAVIKKDYKGNVIVEVNFIEKLHGVIVTIQIGKDKKIESWNMIKAQVPVKVNDN